MPQGFERAERARIAGEYREAFHAQLLPAMRTLTEFVRRPYRSGCRTSAGASALPDRRAHCAHLVRLHTTTDTQPDEIHALGRSEVARVHAEMARLQRHFGFAGSVGEFLQWHAKEPCFRPYRNWPQVLGSCARCPRPTRTTTRRRRMGRGPASASSASARPSRHSSTTRTSTSAT